MKYLIHEKYEQIKKLKILREYTVLIKDSFLSEELWKTTITAFDNNIKELQESIKQMQ